MTATDERLDMWVTQIRFPGDLERRVRAEKEATGMSLNEIICDRVTASYDDGHVAAPSVSVTETAQPTLEDAANMFLALLADDHQRVLKENMKEFKRTAAEYVLSSMKLVYDRGETSYMMPDAGFPSGVRFADATPVPFVEKVLKCELCDNLIDKPYRTDDQRYCHEPEDGSDSCGRKAEQGRIRAVRAEQVEARQSSGLAIDLGRVVPGRHRR